MGIILSLQRLMYLALIRLCVCVTKRSRESASLSACLCGFWVIGVTLTGVHSLPLVQSVNIRICFFLVSLKTDLWTLPLERHTYWLFIDYYISNRSGQRWWGLYVFPHRATMTAMKTNTTRVMKPMRRITAVRPRGELSTQQSPPKNSFLRESEATSPSVVFTCGPWRCSTLDSHKPSKIPESCMKILVVSVSVNDVDMSRSHVCCLQDVWKRLN